MQPPTGVRAGAENPGCWLPTRYVVGLRSGNSVSTKQHISFDVPKLDE
jgi:hypothetical protein